MNVSLNNITIKIIVVYFAVKSSKGSEERNRKIQSEIESVVEDENDPLLIIGDFNGHMNELGEQCEDINGRMVKRFINDYGLILMNLDEKCEGVTTWQRGEQKSVIDYALVNVKMYNLIEGLKIDEDEEIMDISDHKLFDIKLRIEECKPTKKSGNGQREAICLYKVNI